MTIIKTIKQSFKVVGLNPSLALFFILFLLTFNFLLAYILMAKTIIVALLLSFCAFLLLISFFSGWLGLIKNIAKNDYVCEKPFATFLEEIGKNIIPIAIALFVYFFVMLSVILLTGEVNFKIFGNPDAIFQEIMVKAQSPAVFSEYIKNLTDEQKFLIYGWQLTIFFMTSVVNYLFMFYPCALLDKIDTNVFLKPFIALKKTFVFTFKNFAKTLGLYLLTGVFSIVLMFAKQLLSTLKFGGIIFLFLYIYFVIFIVVLIFNYYEKNNCSDGCDSIGENDNCDKISEEA